MSRMRVVVCLAFLCIASLPLSTVSAQPVSTVVVQGSAIGYLPPPCGCPVWVIVTAAVHGTPGALAGTGTTVASTTLETRGLLTGSMNGDVVSLSGTTEQSNYGFIVGTPDTITANAETGEMTFTAGPYPAGPFAGQIFTATGTATVVVSGK